MLNKLLSNKKIVFITIALLLAVCVGVVIIMTSGSKETGGKDTNIKTEQSKGEVDSQDDKKGTDSSDNDDGAGLQVLEPSEAIPENSSDASGSWDNTSDSGTQSGNTNKTDNESDKKDDEESAEDEDILEDDITWGDIY